MYYICNYFRPVKKTLKLSLRTPPGYNNNGNNSSYVTHTGEAETNALTSAGNTSILLPHPAPRHGSSPNHSYIPPLVNGNKSNLLYCIFEKCKKLNL